MMFQMLKRAAISDSEKYLQRLPQKNKSFLLIFLLAVCMNASAQQITVKGKVTSGNDVLVGINYCIHSLKRFN